MDNKCENCGGEGLIHQGESIKFTCSVCGGTGKSVEVDEQPAPVETEVVPEEKESFLGDSSGDSSDDSGDVVA